MPAKQRLGLASLLVVITVAGPLSADASSESASESSTGDARLAWERGVALLNDKQYALAIAHLEVAAQAEPAGPHHQLMLAVAYLGDRRHRDAWPHARMAIEQDPGDHLAQATLASAWMRVAGEGVFNVGQPPDVIYRALGQPDRSSLRGGSGRIEYAFMAVLIERHRVAGIVDMRELTRESLHPPERLIVEHDGRPWRLGHRALAAHGEIHEYVQPGQTVQRYAELLTTQRHVTIPPSTDPRELASAYQEAFERAAEEGRWRLIALDRRAFICETIVPEGSNQPSRHEISRTVIGNHHAHRVAYVRMGPPMSDAERDRWVTRLMRAQVRPTAMQLATPAVEKSTP